MIPRLPGDVSFAHFLCLTIEQLVQIEGCVFASCHQATSGCAFPTHLPERTGSRRLYRDETETIQIPTPLEGEGGGDKTNLSNSTFFLLGNPGIVIQPLKWNCKVTFLNKPCALVRKYLRLASEELSASMMTTAQFLEGWHPYTCAASVWYVLGSSGAKRKYLIFICLPMTWNDEEYWSLRKHDCKNGFLKWNFSTTPLPQIQFLRG